MDTLLENEALVPVGRPPLVPGVPTGTASPVLNACHVPVETTGIKYATREEKMNIVVRIQTHNLQPRASLSYHSTYALHVTRYEMLFF